jgi:hypothetical protein
MLAAVFEWLAIPCRATNQWRTTAMLHALDQTRQLPLCEAHNNNLTGCNSLLPRCMPTQHAQGRVPSPLWEVTQGTLPGMTINHSYQVHAVCGRSVPGHWLALCCMGCYCCVARGQLECRPLMLLRGVTQGESLPSSLLQCWPNAINAVN